MDRTVLITGAGAGIGRATARAFRAAGWRVALMGRREAPLRETAEGAGVLILPADVSQPAEVDSAFARLAAEWGRLDVLFNNAGIATKPAPLDEIPVEDWLAVMHTNISGMVLCARAAFHLMRHQDPQGGRILNNGSISAHAPRPGSVPYTVSKHAVTGLTKTLGLDGRAFNIACGQIDIGNALTEMTQGFTKGVPQADGSTRVEPTMDVAEVAAAVLHMASLPLTTNIPFLTIMARDMPFLGRG
ncbi:SDR family oxidoreductase [Tabrizicola oligotrophica]|uniref:SDR family oxidoreductase n=1 Tax=Tabrizicola oligotrophica TaxID=2710650 RepID=A0A6M0QP10_9RHOB|nr:SDR family oxidoreductase [Tabrizicola oligotrophica]NEY89210.1 SDR family oxidoreductase [Tabrizicola oligotrophica]